MWLIPPRYTAISFCEIEVFTSPAPVLAEVMARWYRGNATDPLCGTDNLTIEASDDNVTWTPLWGGNVDSTTTQDQVIQWSWWNRLFRLPFTRIWNFAETAVIEISSLRENSTYDIFCWATDAIGNSIERRLVEIDADFATGHVAWPQC
jgi:hypothetical protein